MRAWSVEASFFVQAVGERLRMGGTDFSCLTVLLLEGPLSAGDLAERSGLTTGAVTGLVDRLERAGWVRRVPDPADRRRVIVEPVPERAGDLRPLLDPMLKASMQLRRSFSERDIDVVERFVRGATSMLGGEIERLRGGESEPASADQPGEQGPVKVAMPAGGAGGEAGLYLLGLAVRLRVAVAPLGADLCMVDFGAEPPAVNVRGSHVMVSRRRGRWWKPTAPGTILLHQEVPWAVDIRGGASDLDIDLAEGRVRDLSVRGGASNMRIVLPEPDGPVRVRIYGGASKLAISRPQGVVVVVRVRGGAGRVRLDGRKVGSVGGAATFTSDGDTGRPDRFEIEVAGGASQIVVDPRPALSKDPT